MVTRPTSIVPLTLDAKSVERAALQALAQQEKALTRDRERAAQAKRGPITRKINDVRTQMETMRDDINTGQITLTVTGLARGKYRDLLKNHPPREDDDLDQRVGYNVDTFGRALMDAATLEAHDHTGTPVPLDIATWADDEDGVAPGDFERWFRAALALQTTPIDQSPPLRAS